MIIRNKFYSISVNDSNGEINGFSTDKQEFICCSGNLKPLMEIKLLDENGNGVYAKSSNADKFSIEKTDTGYTFVFENIIDGLSGKVYLRTPENEAFCYWSCEVNNATGLIMEWIDMPGLILKDNMKGKGGDSEIFWPFGEGCIIDNPDIRADSEWLHYRELTYQSTGFNGTYPGPAGMQFMAYYNSNGGLYIAAHDDSANLKSLEYHPEGDGVALEMRVFSDGATTSYKLPYEIVMGVFDGDWQDAAEIYRNWLETTDNLMPEKIVNNKNLPEWYSDSPVIAVYPIRGTKDHGDMTPNMYYPYKNVIPYINKYSDDFNSRIMALPMHWEGTAPWAPPYVWPPYGGEEQFKEFADTLHEHNNLLGVYCSGIGWTTHSYLDDMDISDKYQDKFICRTPDNKIVQSKIIGPPIRDGHDMCPESPEVAEIVQKEVEALYNTGCDYTQYFDQNLGGNSCYCYSKNHGHPGAPGKWQSDAMIRIFKKATENVDSKKMLIGCEAAASEPFIKYLPFNDLRYNISYFYGKPVPAYSYVFHEYINNFMGNQNTIDKVFDLLKNPDNLLLRIGYSFSAGDMITVSLAGEGKLFWGWDVEWDVEAPNQEHICELIGNLNPWRRGYAKKYLFSGKMIKPEKVEGVGSYKVSTIDGRIIEYPDVFVTSYESADKNEAIVLTNYLHEEKEIKFSSERKIFTNPESEEYIIADRIKVKPLSAVIAEKIN